MKIRILGSGGAIPTPRPLCNCEVCTKARNEGAPYKRNSCSIYIEDIKALIDCPEDIGDSLNSNRITEVKNLFITHWHPDHTFGLRVLLESNYDFINSKTMGTINLFIPSKVYETLKKRYPTIGYLIDVIKVAKLQLVEDGDTITIGDAKIKVLGYNGSDSETFTYLLESQGKKALLLLCDSISFKRESEFRDLDLLLHECGIFSYDKIEHEISFPDMIKRIRTMNPKRTVLVHIEEVELKAHGLAKLDELEEEHKGLNLSFGQDGQEIQF